MKYRILAILLSILFTVQVFPAGYSYAAQDSSDSSVVRLLDALEIMTLDSQSGMLWDDTPVKRRELAQILCNLFKTEPKAAETPVFADVDDTYRAYVETVVRNGYMNGYNSRYFGPDDYITNEQLIKVFVTVMGGKHIAEVSGGFPYGYVTTARKLKLIDGISGGLQENSRRIDVAELIYAALHADIFQLTGVSGEDSIYTYEDGETFLTEELDLYRVKGIVNMNRSTSLSDPDGGDEGRVRIGNTVYNDADNLAEDYFGCKVNAYVRMSKDQTVGDIIYVEEAYENEVLVLSREDYVNSVGFDINYYKGDKVKSVEISTAAYMIYNGVSVDYDIKRFDFTDGYIRLIDNNGDHCFDVVIIDAYKTYVVAQANVASETISLEFGEDKLVLKDNIYSITKNGAKATLEDINPGEVLFVAASDVQDRAKTIRIEVSSRKVSGTVEGVKNGKKKTIAVKGMDYRLDAYCQKLIEKEKLPQITGGMNGLFYLDANGNIAYFEAGTGDVSTGYLVAVDSRKETFDAATMVFKIYTQAGTMEDYETKDRFKIDGTLMNVSDILKNVTLMRTLQTPQLVQYKVVNDRLTMLDIAKNGYDAEEFSKDAEGALKCYFKPVLDQRYTATADTVLFNVPELSSSSPTYQEIMTDANYFTLYTGTYFASGSVYNVKLYDSDEMGTVKYAVRTYNPHGTHMWEGNGMILVTNIGDGIDADENAVKHIYGIAENGKEIELTSYFDGALTDPTLGRQIKVGDVVQYVKDTKGRISTVAIQHSVDATTYTEMTPLEPGRGTNAAHWKVYGEVYKRDATRLLVSCAPFDTVTSPAGANMLVGNTGKMIYKYNKTNETFTPIDFSEIEYGDKVFACVNSSNVTRMLVVYE